MWQAPLPSPFSVNWTPGMECGVQGLQPPWQQPQAGSMWQGANWNCLTKQPNGCMPERMLSKGLEVWLGIQAGTC